MYSKLLVFKTLTLRSCESKLASEKQACSRYQFCVYKTVLAIKIGLFCWPYFYKTNCFFVGVKVAETFSKNFSVVRLKSGLTFYRNYAGDLTRS